MVLAAGTLFFLILTSVMILRPLRDAMGLTYGIEKLRWLFLVSIGALLLAVPAFGFLVSRVPRRVFLPVSFRLCAAALLGFAVLSAFPEHVGRASGLVYFVFHSIFNLFVVSLFWALMADLFVVAESKRLFPAIAIGGTLGALTGSLFCRQTATSLGPVWLFLISAGLLEAAVWMAKVVTRARAPRVTAPGDVTPIGGHWLAGITDLARSPYMLGIALFVLATSMVYTWIYFTQARIVLATAGSVQQRTILFAHIDVWTQIGTLLAQAFVVGRVMRFLGVGTALAMLPLTAWAGFLVLARSPTVAACTLVGAAYRAVQHGFAVPARETLFTVVDREEKYKAKAFLDTFVFRAGDASGAWLETLLAAPGTFALSLLVFPIAMVWVWLSLVLGKTQTRLAEQREALTLSGDDATISGLPTRHIAP